MIKLLLGNFTGYLDKQSWVLSEVVVIFTGVLRLLGFLRAALQTDPFQSNSDQLTVETVVLLCTHVHLVSVRTTCLSDSTVENSEKRFICNTSCLLYELKTIELLSWRVKPFGTSGRDETII